MAAVAHGNVTFIILIVLKKILGMLNIYFVMVIKKRNR